LIAKLRAMKPGDVANVGGGAGAGFEIKAVLMSSAPRAMSVSDYTTTRFPVGTNVSTSLGDAEIVRIEMLENGTGRFTVRGASGDGSGTPLQWIYQVRRTPRGIRRWRSRHPAGNVRATTCADDGKRG
jgi:hypothetical protein